MQNTLSLTLESSIDYNLNNVKSPKLIPYRVKIKKQISCPQHHRIYYHLKISQRGNTGPKQDQKPVGQTPNSASPCMISKYSPGLKLLFALMDATHFFLLGWFHSLLTAFLGRYSVALAFLIFCGLQGNFNSIDSCSSVRDTHDFLGSSKGFWSDLQLCPL